MYVLINSLILLVIIQVCFFGNFVLITAKVSANCCVDGVNYIGFLFKILIGKHLAPFKG